MRRLFIVDPTLVSLQGHSYNYVRAVAEAATEQFDEVVIYADRGFRPPEGDCLRYQAVLNRWSLDALKGPVNRCFHALARLRGGTRTAAQQPGEHATLVPNVWRWLIRLGRNWRARQLQRSLERILRAGPRESADETQVLLEHARVDELIAVDRLRATLPPSANAVHLNLVLRDSPELVDSGWFGEARFAELLARLARSAQPRIHLFTDSERLTREYRTLGVEPIGTLPVPVRAPAASERGHDQGDFGVAFLGPSRVEKGFCELAQLVEGLPRSAGGRRVRAMIQVTRTSLDPRIQRALGELGALAESLPPGAVEFLESPVPPSTYYSWIERAGVVVLPYVSRKYSSSTSGIFVEAICLGVPVLCPANSWMSDVVENAQRVHGRQIGEVFTTLDDIPRLVAKMAGDSTGYRADVRELSAIWRARHNPRQWLHTLLASAR